LTKCFSFQFATAVQGRLRNESNRDAEQIAHDIFKDGIQVLVDVAGFSNNVVQRTLAMKPAPIQIGYLVFPGTSGADYMDYYLCDPIACQRDKDFTEFLINLPHSFIPPIRELQDTEPSSLSVCLCVCLSVCLSAYLPARLPASLFLCL
jgi:predicted O-linked N-acetylglucosamine transferase (SPINDLY family)